jgi:hypothetical protein
VNYPFIIFGRSRPDPRLRGDDRGRNDFFKVARKFSQTLMYVATKKRTKSSLSAFGNSPQGDIAHPYLLGPY